MEIGLRMDVPICVRFMRIKKALISGLLTMVIPGFEPGTPEL
jgi:hypothetical protein